MAKSDTAKAIAMLQLAFSKELSNERYKLYVEMLSDINPITLTVAVKNLINSAKFLPTIAELREEAGKISSFVNNEEKEDMADAWGLVIKAVGRGGYDRGLEYLDGIVLETARPIWRDICYDENIMATRAHFLKMYEQKLKQAHDRNIIREAVAQIPIMQEARNRAVLGADKKETYLDTYEKADNIVITSEINYGN